MPALTIDRPTMNRAMWDALKNHISKERQRKKQEQEADAAIERLRRERENKQKQDVMTLEETKEQIQQLEQRLGQLKDEKHQLFLQLKKVLNEDEIRRRSVPKETNDMLGFGHSYPTPTVQLGGHPVFLQTSGLSGRNMLYKIGLPHQQSLMPPVSGHASNARCYDLPLVQGALKRPRSPSPPAASYPAAYSYKAQAVAAHNQKIGPYAQAGPYYHAHSSSHSAAAAAAAQSYSGGSAQPVYNYSTHPSFPPVSVSSASQQSPSEQKIKHVQHSYHVQHLQNYGQPLPQQMDQGTPHKTPFTEEMYFGVQGSMHHSQALVTLPQQTKPGGITSGYPVRAQATSSVTYQSPAVQHTAYVTPRHSFSNQGQTTGRYYN